MSPPASHAPEGIAHYENFPVASWLCPPALRPAIVAIYRFARSADDIADEGEAPAQERLEALGQMRHELVACTSGQAPSARWRPVFVPLSETIARHGLPLSPFTDLLDAFEQDVRRSEAGLGYEDRAELLDYCRRSANPVGRLLLHLYGISDPQALAHSDCICSALQLVNFWQDLSVDLPRGRFYLPAQDCRAHGLDPAQPASWPAHPNRTALLRELADWSRALMNEGAPLVHRVPGRAGWELRAVVHGGLRILDKIGSMGFDTFHARPRLHASDALPILWRCARMKQSRP